MPKERERRERGSRLSLELWLCCRMLAWLAQSPRSHPQHSRNWVEMLVSSPREDGEIKTEKEEKRKKPKTKEKG